MVRVGGSVWHQQGHHRVHTKSTPLRSRCHDEHLQAPVPVAFFPFHLGPCCPQFILVEAQVLDLGSVPKSVLLGGLDSGHIDLTGGTDFAALTLQASVTVPQCEVVTVS